jgi:hypothetical protein
VSIFTSNFPPVHPTVFDPIDAAKFPTFCSSFVAADLGAVFTTKLLPFDPADFRPNQSAF